MEETGTYAFVQPGADFTQIQPLDQETTITYINHFVIQTASFLNKFASTTEQKMQQISIKIQNLKTLIMILEAKLDSIAGIDTETAPQMPAAPPPPQEVIENSETPNSIEENAAPPPPPPPPEPQGPIVDPAYLPFLRHLKVGVHPMAVKQEILRDGLDPSVILDDENKPIINITDAIASIMSFSE